jgi:hypothetical protein
VKKHTHDDPSGKRVNRRHVRFGSKAASPITTWRGSYTPHNGHERGRPARPRRLQAILHAQLEMMLSPGGDGMIKQIIGRKRFKEGEPIQL